MGKVGRPGFTYEKVVQIFADEGCKLIEDHYINSQQKLRFVCRCGREDVKDLGHFRSSPQCHECGRRQLAHDYEYVRSFYEQHGCTLLTDAYINSKQILKYICTCGRTGEKSFDEFRHSQLCKECVSNRVKTIDEVREVFAQRGFVVHSTEFVNSKQRLDVTCTNGHRVNIDYNHFQCGRGCPDCRRNKKISIDFVSEYMQDHGCELDVSTYKNSSTKCRYRCHCGEYHESTFVSFRKGYVCTKEDYQYTKWNIELVRDYFSERGCTLLSTEYVNGDEKLDYICECGNASSIAFYNFQAGQRCKQCGLRSISGSNHYNWSDTLTDEVREQKRKTPEYKKWQQAVYKKFKYCCQACGATRVKRWAAHHISNYASDVDGRYDVDNAVLFCDDCHIEFHRRYGNRDNNRVQINEFINDKRHDKEVNEYTEQYI